MKRFKDLTIIEHGGSIAGAYCGKLFADQGARVVLSGDDGLTEAQRTYLQHGKIRGEVVDPVGVDVIIESSALAPLTPAERPWPERGPAEPTPIRVRLSPFGPAGPHSGWQGSDLVDYALSGHLYLYGDPDREPLRGPANQPAYATGLFGFIGAMTALLARERTGRGQAVEVSHVEAMVALHQFTLLRWTMTGDVLRRMGNRFTGQGQPNGLYRSADGWIAIAAPADHQVEALLAVAELDHLLDHPDITSPMDFQTHPSVLDDALGPWLAERPVAETAELLQAMRVPACPATTMSGLLDDPHLATRDIWRQRDGVTVPGSPLRFGHHQPSSGGRSWLASERGGAASGSSGPLAGLRVLDLTRVWAGPLCTRILADLGADVVWVEAPWARGPRRLPPSMIEATRYFPNDEQGDRQWNRNTHIVKYALGKRSLALDLNREEGRELLAELIPAYDVVIENYSPRVMPNFGFDEERIHAINPDAIYVTMPGYGRSGPAEDWLAFGSSVDSHAGLSSLIGYPEQSPWKGGVAWPDPIAGLHAASAILISLWRREADPAAGGLTVEIPQVEASVAVIGDRLVDAQLGGDPPAPGNRQPGYVAQGVYPCAGDDRWVAISIVDDDAWHALVSVIGLDDGLRHDHDALDAALAAWTAGRDQCSVTALLQEAGVAAGAVLDAAGVMADPHLAAGGLFAEVDQPEIGRFVTPRTPIRLSDTPVAVRRPAPTLGRHNHEVLLADTGANRTRLQALTDAGVIADEPPP